MSEAKVVEVLKAIPPAFLLLGFCLSFVYEFTYFFFFGIDIGLLPLSISDLFKIPFFYVMPMLGIFTYFYFSYSKYMSEKKLEDKPLSEGSYSLSSKVSKVLIWIMLVSLNISILWNNPTSICVAFLFFAFFMLLYDIAMLRYRDKLTLAYGAAVKLCFSLLYFFFLLMATLAVYDASKVVIEDDMLYEHSQDGKVITGKLLRSYDRAVVLYDTDNNNVVFIRFDSGIVSSLKVHAKAVNFLREKVELNK